MSRFCPLFSSSKGNSIYISGGSSSILIDCGVSAKRLETALKEIEVEPRSIDAIFITHEHSDHIGGLRVFASRHSIPVYTSAGTLSYLEEACMANKTYDAAVIPLQGMEVNGLFVKPFHTSHDTRESVCYTVSFSDGGSAAVATDLGYIGDEVLSAIRGCNLVMLESNHDINMLKAGAYPYYLKQRILSNRGHLSNESCARVLPELLQSGSTRFILGHLSEENNIPQLAYQTSFSELREAGATCGTDYLLNIAKPCGNCLTLL